MISLGVGRYGDELNLALHRRNVDHRLNLGDPLGMKPAYIRTIDVDEMQDDDLASEIRQTNRPAIGVEEREIGSLAIDSLKILLLIGQLLLQLFERMRGGQRPVGKQAKG